LTFTEDMIFIKLKASGLIRLSEECQLYSLKYVRYGWYT